MRIKFLLAAMLGVSLCAAAQNPAPDLSTLHTSAENALRARDLDKAAELSNALASAAALAGNRREAAFADLNLGRVLSAQGDYTRALETFDHALHSYREITDDIGAANVMVDQSIADSYIGRLSISFELLDQAKAAFEKANDKAALARMYYELGNAYINADNYRSALEALQHALQLTEETDQQRFIGNITNSIGNVYNHQQNWDIALEFYQRSLKIKEQSANYYEIISTLVNTASVYTYMNKFADAHIQLDRALQLSRDNDPRSRAQVLNRYGRVLFEEKKYDEAMARLQETLTLLAGGKDEPLRGDTLVRIGRIQVETNQLDAAMTTASEAIALAERLHSPIIELLSLEVRGVAAFQMDAGSEDALEAFSKMIDIQEELRGNIAGGASQDEEYLSAEGDEMHGVVELLVRRHHEAAAFQMSERDKGRALLAVLGSDGDRLTKRLTSGERSREIELEKALGDANLQLQRVEQQPGIAQPRLSELQDQVAHRRLAVQAFETTLYAAHPELQVQRNRATPVSVEQAAAIIPNSHTLLLEYDLGPEHSFLFTVSKDSSDKTVFNMHELAVKPKELTKEIKTFHDKIAGRDLEYVDAARKLYDDLIGPIAGDLNGKDTLIIVPDAELWEVPFEALESPARQALIETHAMFLAPSMTVLSRLKVPAETGNRTTLLAIGDIAVGQELPDLRSLYGANRSRVMTGAQATESAVKAVAAQYRIVHLAAHGFYDDKHPMYSYLQLGRTGDKDTEDGRLEAREMMTLNLNAELVVLSGCETARGQAAGGEGIVGMTWALLVAGVPTTVASQWKVDSASTADLMVRFHRNLSIQLGQQQLMPAKAKALQRAIVSLMKNPQYRHPFYWAGFVMIGNGL